MIFVREKKYKFMSELKMSVLILGENVLFLEKFTLLGNFYITAASAGSNKSHHSVDKK